LSLLPLDTAPEDYTEEQLRWLRSLTPEQKGEIVVQMSEHVREVARAGIRSRHPEYTPREMTFALVRLLHGDDFFRRAWPKAPLLDS
jgi:hypothetical protein